MSFADRIKEIREGYNLSQAQLAIKLSVSPSTVAHWELGDRNPTIEMLNKIVDKFDVTLDYLVGKTTVPNGEVITKLNAMSATVPVYGRIPAGLPFEAIEDRLDDVYIPDFLLKKKDRLFGLVIEGDSMSKILPNGSIGVFLKQDTLENGEIGAILVNGYDATVKKFYRLTDSVLLEPVSYNEEHKPIIIKDNSDPVSILGKLVWYCAPNDF